MHIRKLSRIGRTYRHIQRYSQIITVLIKYGFEDLIESLKLEQYIDAGLQILYRKRREKIERYSRSERVRMALEELGPTFIKMGQILSTRPDLLPVRLIRELEKLQDDVPPFAYEKVKEIIEKEFCAPIENIFQHIDETPLASASIGQVHRARLLTGEEVVVKIQRPDIRRKIEVDLEIMLHLSTLIEKHVKSFEIHRPTRIVEEFARTVERELDYTLEASNMERFKDQFKDDPHIYVPKIYRDITTTRVLTMEYIDGIKASEVHLLDKAGLDRELIAKRGFDLIIKQIFVHGFFHADPHPGNVFILPNNVICYLDFGMMGRISRKMRENFANLVMNIVRRDEERATEAVLQLMLWDDPPDYYSLERDVGDLIDTYFYRPLKDVNLGKLLQQLLEMTSRHRLRIPPDLFLMIKALSSAEGLGRRLDPNFDATKEAAPIIRRIYLSRFNPKRILEDIFESGSDILNLVGEIPQEIREILRQARQGRVKMEFAHRGLEPLITTHDKISNRIAFAIVLASLIIGSSLIVLSGVPPKWHEIPIIGLAGYIVAGVMGFWLLISTMKSGKM